MQRRDFLKGAAILSAAGTVMPVLAASTQAHAMTDKSCGRRRFTLTNTYQLVAPEGSAGVVKLWVPLPENTAFQQVEKLNFSGTYQDAYISANNHYGAKTLFATWPDAKGKMTLTLELVIETQDWEPVKSGELSHYRAPAKPEYPADVAIYLKPTKHIDRKSVV